MEIIKNIQEIKNKISCWKKEANIIGLVPTMGALHIGHESLIKEAKKQCDKVVVSIFVNPIQFGAGEDYECYPRQLDIDAEICQKHGINLIFAPEIEEMYPCLENLTQIYPPETFKDKLCGSTRKGHFEGVCTVVSKLFNIITPDKAFFGQKDAQQLLIIEKMVQDLNIPVEIIRCPIIGDADELACSSRNTYLSAESRKKALTLNKTLKKVVQIYNSGTKLKEEVFEFAKKELHKDVQLEYLQAYDVKSFKEQKTLQKGTLIAIAAKVDGTRLIDNLIID